MYFISFLEKLFIEKAALQKEKDREVFYLLVHSPLLEQTEAKSQELLSVSHIGSGGLNTRAVFCYFSQVISYNNQDLNWRHVGFACYTLQLLPQP